MFILSKVVLSKVLNKQETALVSGDERLEMVHNAKCFPRVWHPRLGQDFDPERLQDYWLTVPDTSIAQAFIVSPIFFQLTTIGQS